jgi:hypothetical protein
VITPSFWTCDEDFSEADLVLPSLRELGIRKIKEHLSVEREYQ